jgi:hypothetical protein
MTQTILMMGLPRAGKTTFIAALWHLVQSRQLEGALRLERLEGDREYLTRIAATWGALKDIGRTQIGPTELVRMRLTDERNAVSADLVFPDLSGETFNGQWLHRAWDQDFARHADASRGLLLFIHPKNIRAPVRIDAEAQELAAILPNSATPVSAGAKKRSDLTAARDPKTAPTQVMLVDLLQFLSSQLPAARKLPIGVVVSAWDKVSAQGLTPEQWLEETLPLLLQYLTANAARFPFSVFGVSAIGGDLTTDRVRLQGFFAAPWKRIQVVMGDKKSHDLSLPIRWHLEREEFREP